MDRAFWSSESCGLKVILSEQRNRRVLKQDYSKINHITNILRFLKGMLKGMRHRIPAFSSARSSSLLFKGGKQPLAMFLCLQSWVQTLYVVLGTIATWTHSTFSSSFSTFNAQTGLSHSGSTLFYFCALAHALPFVTIRQHPTHLSISNSHTTLSPKYSFVHSLEEPRISVCSPSSSSVSCNGIPFFLGIIII